MYRHTDIYTLADMTMLPMYPIGKIPPIYISAIFAHKGVALLLCMERSETQVATSSLTLID